MIERSCPSATVTTAAPPRRLLDADGSTSARSSAKPSRSIPIEAQTCRAADALRTIDELAVGKGDQHLAVRLPSSS